MSTSNPPAAFRHGPGVCSASMLDLPEEGWTLSVVQSLLLGFMELVIVAHEAVVGVMV